MDVTWTIRLEDGKVLREGQLANHDRAWGVAQLMESFAHQLPDMTLVYNGHDGARISITSEERTRLENLANSGQCEFRTCPARTETDPFAQTIPTSLLHFGRKSSALHLTGARRSSVLPTPPSASPTSSTATLQPERQDSRCLLSSKARSERSSRTSPRR